MSPRDRILARRAKFMVAAFASAGIVACSDGTAQVCLGPLPPPDTGRADARNDAGADTADTEPMVCLTADPDTGVDQDDATDATTDVADTTDTGPMPCLTPLPDGGV